MAEAEATKPVILLVCIRSDPFFDRLYGKLLTELESKATLKRVEDATLAVNLVLEDPQPSAVLIANEELTRRHNSFAWDAILQYVRQGGTTVLMGQFSSLVRPNNMQRFFCKAGLRWESGSYYRATHVLNQEVVGDDLAAHLLSSYSMKAVSVKNVALLDSWYVTNASSIIESNVFAATNAHNPDESAVALARVGNGRVGYIGDVNAEYGSNAVVLAMCGLHG